MPQSNKTDVKIEEKKLGRRRYKGHQIVGWANEKKQVVEIDSRLKKRARLRAIIHEAVHLAVPESELCETKVLKIERIVGNLLWKDGYRNEEKE